MAQNNPRKRIHVEKANPDYEFYSEGSNRSHSSDSSDCSDGNCYSESSSDEGLPSMRQPLPGKSADVHHADQSGSTSKNIPKFFAMPHKKSTKSTSIARKKNQRNKRRNRAAGRPMIFEKDHPSRMLRDGSLNTLDLCLFGTQMVQK